MRDDANRLALRAVRGVLQANEPVDLDIDGVAIHAEPVAQPQPTWPRELEGLEASIDGPWPAPVQVNCSWDGGSTKLLVDAGAWPRSSRNYPDLVGLRVRVIDGIRELFWATVANILRDAQDGDEVAVPCYMTTWRQQTDPDPSWVTQLIPQLRALGARSGLPMRTRSNAEMFRVAVPSGSVLPDGGTAWKRVIHASLIKLPFLLRGGQRGIEGKPFLDLTLLDTPSEVAPERGALVDKRYGLSPLPGGVRRYAATLLELLGWLAEEPRTAEDMEDHLRENYEVHGTTARGVYVGLLPNLGLAGLRANRWELSDAGSAYLADPEPAKLFEILDTHYAGLLETLVIAEVAAGASTSLTHEILKHLLDKSWESNNQTSFRRNWLLSMGLTDRTKNGDVLTPLGQSVIAARPERSAELRTEVQGLLDLFERTVDEPGDEDDEPALEEAAPVADVEPVGWKDNRLDLKAGHVQLDAKGLRLPVDLLERAVAALSAGKHLLLVGPPGTGKTELAVALAEAASDEGYCNGALLSTASADWTTFDTIGGYHLRKDGSLTFRPGVFLRAIESWRWLLIDELNRADVDRAFGELMTVLSGAGTETPFELDDGRHVSVGPEDGRTHWMPRTFRVLATMNTWDKTSLFRLSYAVQRRFAMIHVEPPEDHIYADLVERWACGGSLDPPLDEKDVPPLQQFFSSRGLLAHRAVGPAVAKDLLRYLRRRAAGGDGLAEGLTLYLLPQLEGLESEDALRVHGILRELLTGWASELAVSELLARYEELFPHVKFSIP